MPCSGDLPSANHFPALLRLKLLIRFVRTKVWSTQYKHLYLLDCHKCNRNSVPAMVIDDCASQNS